MDSNKTIGLDSIIKQHFTSTDKLRPAMCQLHRDGDNVVATDAHVLIVCPIKYIDDLPGSVDKFPPYNRVIPPHDSQICIFSIDVAALSENLNAIPVEPLFSDCDECEGTGIVHCKCCGNDAECTDCDGSGDANEIIGNTRPSDKYRLKIKNNFFAPDYINAMLQIALALGCKELRSAHFIDGESPKVFYADDILMLVMPLITSADVDKFKGSFEEIETI